MRFALRKREKFPAIIWLIPLIAGMAAGTFWLLELHMKPTLLVLAEVRGKMLATQAIHEVVREQIGVQPDVKGLLDIKMDQQGRVAFIQPNTAAFNRISSEIAVAVQERLYALTEEQIGIPFGQVFGSAFFANTGPRVMVRILPAGTVQVHVMNRFEAAGINQTKHMVSLTVTSEIQIVVPLVSKSARVEAQIPLAEYVVVGEVPGTYLQVPLLNEGVHSADS